MAATAVVDALPSVFGRGGSARERETTTAATTPAMAAPTPSVRFARGVQPEPVCFAPPLPYVTASTVV